VAADPVRAADPVVKRIRQRIWSGSGSGSGGGVQGPVVALAPVAEDMAADPVVEADQAADMVRLRVWQWWRWFRVR